MQEPRTSQSTITAVSPILSAHGISKSFPGVRAVDEVSITLRPGEIHALVGENGSGKSTLAKVLYGEIQPDAGTIEVDGRPVSITSPKRARDLGIVAISQELTLASTLSVTENILMSRLPLVAGVVNWRLAHVLARDALEQLGVDVDPRQRVDTFPIELQQEFEVARAISASPRVLILDEATSSLSEVATDHLLAKLAELRRAGVALLFISHKLAEVYACAQIATVLRDGELIGTVNLSETPDRQLVRMMVGREIAELFRKRNVEQGESRLVVSGLTTADQTVRDVSFEVREGEIVGIAGLVGSGKSELAMALAGAYPISRGNILLSGRPARLRSPRKAIAQGVGFVPEDRKRSALLPTRSVRQNFSVAWHDLLSRFGVIRVYDERRLARAVAQDFAVRTRSLATSISNLSGGNQQKVVLGRLFTRRPSVIVLSEPTRGIDVGAKSEVYRFIQDRAEEGAGIVMVSSELPELLGLADRILVMFRGQVCAEYPAREALEEEITHAALGGPPVARQQAP